MIQLFKRANAKGGSEKEGEQKWNGDSLFVKIDNEYVSLSELKRTAKENDFEPLSQKVENEIEMDGENHNVNDLIALYKNRKKKNMTDKEDPALQTAIKGMKKFSSKKNKDEDEEDEKENEKEDDDEKENEMTTQVSEGGAAGAKDNPDEVEVKAKKASKKNKDEDEEDEEKENEKSEEDEVEEKIEKSNKNSKKDVKHFVRLNSARENGMLVDEVQIDTMHNRVDRGKSSYGSIKK